MSAVQADLALIEAAIGPTIEAGENGCVLWTGSRDKGGYARVGRGGARVHRLVYERMVGPIPEGLTIDHLCRIRNCVNPAHLGPVTHVENTMRGESFAAVNARKTHCPHGHPYFGDNLRIDAGDRRCKACRAKYGKRLRDSKKRRLAEAEARVIELEALLADDKARVRALLPADQPSLAHSSETDEMRADADPPLGLEHRLRIAADGVWFNSADHNAPHGIHSLRALYREAADALQAATQERDRQKEVIDSAMGPTWAQFDALYDVIESLTAGLREIKERSKCVIGNAVLSKHDGRFCAYHAAQAALATTTATAVVSEDEDDEWKLTFEKATPLHIGPCPRCVVLEAALRPFATAIDALGSLTALTDTEWLNLRSKITDAMYDARSALVGLPVPEDTATAGAGGTDNSPEQGSEARPAETAGARGGSRCECDELGRGPDDECIYTNPCEIVVRPPRDRGGKQS